MILTEPKRLIAEIIYTGSVIERGRCYNNWQFGYHQSLKKHIGILYQISYMAYNEKYDGLVYEIIKLKKMCKRNRFFKKRYAFLNYFDDYAFSSELSICYRDKYGTDNKMVDEIIFMLISELKTEVGYLNPNKKRLYSLFNSIHNLPRIYFCDDNMSLKKNVGLISVKEAIDYFSSNLDPDIEKILYSKLDNESHAKLKQLMSVSQDVK